MWSALSSHSWENLCPVQESRLMGGDNAVSILAVRYPTSSVLISPRSDVPLSPLCEWSFHKRDLFTLVQRVGYL